VKLSKNFYDHELRCRGSGKLTLHPGFVEELQALRDDVFAATAAGPYGPAGRGMVLLSGCRSFEYNAQIGGHEKSLHICDRPMHPGQEGTLAVDAVAADGYYRGVLFYCAWKRGWSIGWNAAKKFLHLDRRDWVGLKQSSFDY